MDQDTLNHIKAVESVDRRSVPKYIREALDEFVVGCKSDPSPVAGRSNWDSMAICSFMLGARSLNAALVPLKGEIPNAHGFVQSDYLPNLGLRSNHFSKYLSTGLASNSLPQNDFSCAAYASQANTSNTLGFLLGAGGNESGASAIYNQTGQLVFRSRTQTPYQTGTISVGGFIGQSRVDSNVYQTRFLGANSTFTQPSQAPVAHPFYVFRTSNGFENTNYGGRLAFYMVGMAVDLAALEERVSKFVSVFDADVETWMAGVEVKDGYAVTSAVEQGVYEFVTGCKADASPNEGVSNWDALRACCLMAGPATLDAALTPLKGPAPTNNNFNQDDYNQVLGLKGNLVNKWLDSNIDHSTLVPENSSLSIFVTEPEDSSINSIHTLMGFNPGTGNRFRLTRSSTGLIRGMFPGSSAVVTVPEITTGFWGGSRATPAIAYGRYGGITYTTTNFLGGGWASRNLRVFRAHDSNHPTDARIAYYHIGEAVDLIALEARVDAYMSAITMGYDPDAAKHIYAVERADGMELPKHRRKAIHKLVVGCKSDPSPIEGVSNWEAIKACCLLAGPQTLSGALVPIKGPTPTNFNFIDDDYDSIQGLKGDAVSKRLSPRRTNDQDPQDNCHASVWVTEPITERSVQGKYLAGTNTLGAACRNLHWGANNPSRVSSACNNAGAVSPHVETTWPGLFGVSRHDPMVYVERRPSGTRLVEFPSSTPSGAALLLFSRGNLASDYSNARIAFYSIGESVDLELLDRRVSRYMKDVQGTAPARRRRLQAHRLITQLGGVL